MKNYISRWRNLCY